MIDTGSSTSPSNSTFAVLPEITVAHDVNSTMMMQKMKEFIM
jgi:hypothetical protein